MEPIVETQTSPAPPSLIQPQPNKNVLGIVSTVLCVGLIGFSALMYTQVQNLRVQLETEVNATNTKLVSAISSAKDAKDSAVLLTKYVSALDFAHRAEGNVVTNDLIVEKLNVSNFDPLELSVDVVNQPSTALKYEGKGVYTMEDRDVKAMVSRLMEDLREGYNGYAEGSDLPKWTDTTAVPVTVQNYEIGTFKGKVFTLKGE
jgi:hypothetical protein